MRLQMKILCLFLQHFHDLLIKELKSIRSLYPHFGMFMLIQGNLAQKAREVKRQFSEGSLAPEIPKE
jgi:hypothetical protein